MDKANIIKQIAQERMVESMVQNIAHQALNDDLSDLCQMVYLILLEYDDDKLQDLWENNQIRFFLARIIVNQYRSSNSPFHILYRKFRTMVDEEIMKFTMGNCITLEDTNGNRMIYKKRYEHKIDNVAALMDAYVAYKV